MISLSWDFHGHEWVFMDIEFVFNQRIIWNFFLDFWNLKSSTNFSHNHETKVKPTVLTDTRWSQIYQNEEWKLSLWDNHNIKKKKKKWIRRHRRPNQLLCQLNLCCGILNTCPRLCVRRSCWTASPFSSYSFSSSSFSSSEMMHGDCPDDRMLSREPDSYNLTLKSSGLDTFHFHP